MAAALDGDGEDPSPERAEAVLAFAREQALPPPPVGELEPQRPSGNSPAQHIGAADATDLDAGPYLIGVETTLQLRAWAARTQLGEFGRRIDQSALAQELRDKVDELGATERDIVAVAETLSRHQFSLPRCEAVAKLADRYAEASPGLAAELYVMAWCASRGGRGWDRYGGLEHRDLLEHAADADRRSAVRRLAREVAYTIDDDEYCLGVTRRLVEAQLVLGADDDAVATWDRAMAAVAYRLPETGGEPTTWSAPQLELTHDVTVAYACLLGACLRLPHCDRRAAALAGLAELIVADQDLGAQALGFLLSSGATVVDTIAALSLLLALGDDAAATREALMDVLDAAAASQPFGIQVVAAQLVEAAGGVPPVAYSEPARGRGVTWDEIDEALREDPQQRVHALAECWNGIQRRVAERYWYLWRSTGGHAAIDQAQAEVQFSRAHDSVPAAPLWRWSRELFDCALHDVLPELRGRMVLDGSWRDADHAVLADLVNPQTATAAARGRSRTVRPRVPGPGAAQPGEREPLVLDGPWEGFVVAAYWEDELVEEQRGGAATRRSASAGLVAAPSDMREGDMPFRAARSDFRWHQQGPGVAPSATAPGRVTSWWVQHDALAWDRAATIREDVRLRLGWIAAPLPAALNLVSAGGELRACWRTWWMRPWNYDFGPTTPRLRGGALLVSPDGFEELLELFGDLRLAVEAKSTTVQ